MMRQVFVFVLIGISVLFCGATTAAQSSIDKKFELSAQFTIFNDPVSAALEGELGRKAEPGFGGRLGYNLNSNLALEAELNFFPRDSRIGFLGGGAMTQGLFGLKVGRRFNRIGLFGKFRPGFTSYARADRRRDLTVLDFQPARITHLAFDLGGVVEIYSSRRTFVRFDLGDTVVRYRKIENLINTDGTGPFSTASVTRHNLQFSVGFGFRF